MTTDGALKAAFENSLGAGLDFFFLSMALNLESMNLDSEKKNNPLRCLAKAVLLDRDPVER